MYMYMCRCDVLSLSAAEASALTDETPFGSMGGDSTLAVSVASLGARHGMSLPRHVHVRIPMRMHIHIHMHMLGTA